MRSRTLSAAPLHACERASLIVVAGLFVGLMVTPALGAASPSADAWPQFQADGAHSGSTSAGPQPPYRQIWRFDPGLSGRFGVSAPVVAGDLAVTVAPRALYGVDLATGTQEWALERDFGPSVPPALVDDGARTLLVYTEGFGPNPPSEVFAAPTEATSSGSAPSPTASGSPSGGSADPGSDAPFDSRVAAVDLATQQPVWDAPVQLDAISRTGVTVEGTTVYVGDDDGVVTAIDAASGEVRWSYDAPGPVATSIAATAAAVVLATQPEPSTPAVVIALDPTDGSERWRFAPAIPSIYTVAAIEGDTVYLGSTDQTGSRMLALALADGSRRWETAVNSQVSPLTSPIATGEAIVAVDAYTQVYGLDPATGERIWDHALNTLTVRGVPVLVGHSLLIATAAGELAAIDTDSHDLTARAAGTGPGGYLGPIAVTSQLVIAVKGGHQPGLVAFAHDPLASLTSIPSPTVLSIGTMLGNFALAALPLLLLLGLFGRWLRAHLGPAFAEDLLDPEAGGGPA